MMAKRTVLYARVSTDDQADKGYSLPSQLDLCRKYAERLGYSVVGELTEDFTGVVPIAERPTGKQLAAMVKARQVDALIVYQVDRLSRDIVNLLATVQTWLRAGLEIHTCDIGKIESELDIVLVIKGWQGSDERKKIRERTMRGKRAKAESGSIVVCGHAPYGYAYLRDEKGRAVSFEIVEECARIVRLIFRWYVYGDESGARLSARGITRRLSQMRIPTPGEMQRGYARKRGAGIWNEQAILQIISNEVYAGVWRYGVIIGHTNNRRSLEEATCVSVPSIIDRDEWERAQAQRGRNKQLAMRNCKRNYLLRGLIKCECGAAMCGQHSNRGLYYACVWQNNSARSFDHCQCVAKWTRADAIEADIWHEIEELFSDLDRLWAELKKAQQKELDLQEPKRDELKAIEGLLEQTDNEAREIAAALPKASGRVGETLNKKMEEVNARYDALTQQREKLIAELGARKLTDDAIDEIMDFARKVRKGIKRTTPKGKRHLLEVLDVRVIIKGNGERFNLKCILGEAEGEIRKIDRRRKGGIMVTSPTPR